MRRCRKSLQPTGTHPILVSNIPKHSLKKNTKGGAAALKHVRFQQGPLSFAGVRDCLTVGGGAVVSSTKVKRSAGAGRRRAYPGGLNTPIYATGEVLLILDLFDEARELSERDRGNAEYVKALNLRRAKLPLLFEHFGINDRSPTKWEKLAWRLALEHVPGFQVSESPPRKIGRPPKWTQADDIFLLDQILEIRGKSGKSIRHAFGVFLKRNRDRYPNLRPDTLERRFYAKGGKIFT